MARPILSEYGPDTPKSQAARASSGGIKPGQDRDVMNYSPPKGPIGISRVGVGLGGANLGNCGTQGSSGFSGDSPSGSAGLGGKNRGMGTNRRG